MNESLEKILWIIGLILNHILLYEFGIFFSITLVWYSIFMGAYFRGKNWWLGWNKVKEIKVKGSVNRSCTN